MTRAFWRTVQNCEATRIVDLGSDHKAIHLRSEITRPRYQQSCTKTRQQTNKKFNTSWPPADKTSYTNNLTAQLDNTQLSQQLDERCRQIEEAIKAALDMTNNNDSDILTDRSAKTIRGMNNKTLDDLISQRRATSSRDTLERSKLSKLISKEVRAINRARRRAQIDSILQRYKDLKRIANIKDNNKKQLIPSMTTSDGHTRHDRKDIADIFADFYEALYSQTEEPNHSMTTIDDHDERPIPLFTADELEIALKQLKNGRSKDTSGILAEMLKEGGATLLKTLLDLYNELLQPNKATPSQWRQTQITVMHKSGDTKLP